MASQDSATLVVGSLISFKSKLASEGCFNGTVYFFDPKDGRFGIEDVMCQEIRGGFESVEGNYQFSLKDIKDLRVISLPRPLPESTTNTKKDDQKSNPHSDASSSGSS